MQFWQQLWKRFDKVRKNNSKSEFKTFVRKGLHSKIFPSRVPLRVLKAVPEQWYISLVESPKLPLRFEKFYELWFFFKKFLRLYLQTCGVLKWKQCRQKIRTGGKIYLMSAKIYELLNIFKKKTAQSLPLDR